MQFIITKNTSDCSLGAAQSFEKSAYSFVSFGSNPYSDCVATIAYLKDNKKEEHHYSKKANPAFVAKQIVEWGLSAPFLAAEPLLEDSAESNQQALDFYNLVKQEILTIATYKVAVAVSVENKYNYDTETWDTYTYTPFFLRSSYYSDREVLALTLPVDTDYNEVLTSDTVLKYVDQFRVQHQKTIEEKALVAQKAVLAYEQGRTQATNLLVGATFIGLSGDTLRFLSADGVEFSVYAAMVDYEECALFVGGNEI